MQKYLLNSTCTLQCVSYIYNIPRTFYGTQQIYELYTYLSSEGKIESLSSTPESFSIKVTDYYDNIKAEYSKGKQGGFEGTDKYNALLDQDKTNNPEKYVPLHYIVEIE
jgi:hypothetical protein